MYGISHGFSFSHDIQMFSHFVIDVLHSVVKVPLFIQEDLLAAMKSAVPPAGTSQQKPRHGKHRYLYATYTTYWAINMECCNNNGGVGSLDGAVRKQNLITLWSSANRFMFSCS